MAGNQMCISGYSFKEQLYNGSRTLVYRAIRDSDQKSVVIKLLKNPYPDFSELLQFRNQYSITKNIKSPTIIQTYSLELYQNSYALIMEDMGGVSLKQYFTNNVETRYIASLQEFLQIAISLCDALLSLAEYRIIHKDIKPANILINPETKQIKLIDFSIASLLPREKQSLLNLNVVEGTLAYISPEQTGRMNRGIDYRSDFYALGVTFYELLTGELPFKSDDAMELIHCHIAKAPPAMKKPHSNSFVGKERGQEIFDSNSLLGKGKPHPNPLIGKERGQEIPEVISDIVMKLMAKNAEDRYQSALGLKYDLEVCLEQFQKTGNIEYFEIAQRDICDRFIIPEKLYGRKTEVQELLAAFERVREGNSELMLVAGFSGIGKTAVVNEIHKPIVKQKGYFIKGKFDQFNRNIPFSAFVQALRNLMGQLLSEDDAQLSSWKDKILQALGENGQVIIDVIPELEQIIGKQAQVPELSGIAAQNRFNLLFQKFIQVFTTKQHPLVIFLDDLQWADSASLKLMKLLMSESGNGYLLLIGAYRNNEVFPAHPLTLTLSEIDKAQGRINTISLAPLTEDILNKLVSDALNCTPEISQPLTQLIYQKTQGNPFFSTQFLESLHDDGLIKFDFDNSFWECDISLIKSLSLTDDVVEFMALQLQKLPEETQNILKLAACIGNEFDLSTLAIVCEQSEIETAKMLWKALQENLILPQSEVYKFYLESEVQHQKEQYLQVIKYKFLHDRVQEAAYSLIPEAQKQATHLKIGELLLNNTSESEREENIFAIVNQLNIGANLIYQQKNRLELAKLNLIAAKKAKSSTAYGVALKYSTVGIELLAKENWETEYELTLMLYLQKAEVEYLNGNFHNSSCLIEIILSRTKNILDSVKAYQLKIEVAIAQVQMQTALEIGLNVIKILGIELEQKPPTVEQVESLINLPRIIDEYKKSAITILMQTFDAAYIANPELLAPMTFTAVNLCIKYGNSNLSIQAFVCYALLLCGSLNDIETGYSFGKLSLQILEEFDATEYRGVALCSFNGYVRLWKESVKETIDSLLLAYYSSLESGEIIHSGYAILNYCTNSFLAGESLDAVEEKHNLYIEELEKQKLNYHVVYGKIGRQLILNLMGKAENPLEMTGEAFQESEIIPLLVEQNNGTSLYYVYLAKAILCYLFAQPKKAIAHLKAAENYLTTVSGLFISAQYNFYQSLAILALYPYQEKAEQYNSIIKITANQEKMENWAYHAPMNFQHKYDLIAAEKSRVLGKRIQAIELYEIAISGAKDNEYLHEEALANELAAKFYLDWDKEKIAATYMQEAYQCYARWGSLAKIEDLEKRYPKLLLSLLQKQSRDLELNKTQFQNLNQSSFNKTITITHSNSSSISENLDLASILKASQALSSEIHLEQLISKLMQVIIENAGAKKAALILLEEDTLMLKAVANNSQNIELLDLPCHHSKEIPNTVINYVKRSLKTAVFDNAIKNPDFIGDSYLIEQKSKSLLCMPILNQGQLIGLLYLENNLTIGAFTKNRLDIINLLVTQAAFSLKNAQLYAKLEDYSHTLEQKVELRTQEATQRAIQLESTLKKLQRSQAQLIQTEKMSGLAQVVAGVAHEINNPINFISANLTPASEYVQSLIELISLQQNLSSQHLPKVEAKIAEIELDYLIEDLPKLLTSMETGATRIKEIVLSLRNFSRLDEAEIKFVDIHQGIDSTLLILQHQLNSNAKYPAIEVIKKYSQLPKISCYASQLNQVFLNIINNAIYALRDKQEKQPAITITTLLKNKGRISISIKDNGMGINQSVVDKIFDPFFTTKPVGSGTGLGLSTSYSIVVKKHNGKLSCNSILGEGTEFILELPINSEQ